MIIKITPQTLDGTIHVPASKSMTHRELIASALAKGSSTLRNVTMSKDIEATIRILRQFGAVIDVEKERRKPLSMSRAASKSRKGRSSPMPANQARRFVSSSRSAFIQETASSGPDTDACLKDRSRLTTTFSMKKALRTRLNPADCLSPLKENGKAAFSSSREM